MRNTVKDLIEALQKLPADAVIQIQKDSQSGPTQEWANFDIDNDVFFYDKKNIVKLGDI